MMLEVRGKERNKRGGAVWKGRKNWSQMCFYQEQQSGSRQSCGIVLYCTFELTKIQKTYEVMLSRFSLYWCHQDIIQSPRSLPSSRVLNRVLASVTIPRWRSFAVCRRKWSSSDFIHRVYSGNSWAVSVKNLIDVLQGVFIHAVVNQVDWLVLCLFAFFEDLKHTSRQKLFSFSHYFSLILKLSLRNVINSGRAHLLAGVLLFCDHPRSCRCRALYLFDRLNKQLRIEGFFVSFLFLRRILWDSA